MAAPAVDPQLKAVLDEAVLMANLGSKTWGGQTYKDIFTGETLINVLLKDSDKYPSRETAVQYAQGLLNTLVITCITKRRTFDDGDRLYCINREKSTNDDSAPTVVKTTRNSPSTNVSAAEAGKETTSKLTNHENTKARGHSEQTAFDGNGSRFSGSEPTGGRPSSTSLFRLLEKDATKRNASASRNVTSSEKTAVETTQGCAALKDKHPKTRKDDNLASRKMNTSKPNSAEKSRGLAAENITLEQTDKHPTTLLSDNSLKYVTRSCLTEKESVNSEKHLHINADNCPLVDKQKLSKTLSPALTALIEKDERHCQKSRKKGGTQEGKVKQVVEDVVVIDDDEVSKSWDVFEVKLQNKIKTQRRSPGKDVSNRHEGLSMNKNNENEKITFSQKSSSDEEEKVKVVRRLSCEKPEVAATKEELSKEKLNLNLQGKLVVDDLSMPSVTEGKNTFLGLGETEKAKDEHDSSSSAKIDPVKSEHSKRKLNLNLQLSVNSEELLMPSVMERKNSFLAMDESGKAKDENLERRSSSAGKANTGSREKTSSFSLREGAKPVIIEEAGKNSLANIEVAKEVEFYSIMQRVPSFSSREDSKTVIVDSASQEKTSTLISNTAESLSPQEDLVRVSGHTMPKTLAALLARDGSDKRDQAGDHKTNVFKNKLKELKKTGTRVAVPLIVSPRTKAQSSAEPTAVLDDEGMSQVDGRKGEISDITGTRHAKDIKDAASISDNVGKGTSSPPVFIMESNLMSTAKASDQRTVVKTNEHEGTVAESQPTVSHLSSEKLPESPGYVIPRLNLQSHHSENVPFDGADLSTRASPLDITPASQSSPTSLSPDLPLELRKKLQNSRRDFEESKLKYENHITELQLQIDFLHRQKSGQMDEANGLDSSASMSDLTSLYSSFSTPLASPSNSNVTSPAVTPCVTPRGSIVQEPIIFSPVSPPPPPPAPPSLPTTNGYLVKPTKEIVNPRVNMKPLFWNRIISCEDSDKKGKCVWKSIKEPVIDTTEFERLFSKKGDDRKLKRTKSLRDDKHFAHSNGKKVAKLLDMHRARAIGIKMSSLSCQLEDIRKAVYNMDTSEVDMESLQSIYDIYPKEEEIQLIEEHVKKLPPVPLDKPEEFMYQLTKMKHFKERLECWLFQEKFSEIIYGIERSLACVTESCSIISTNAEIASILALVLAYGNYMNGNTVRGQADGFHLDVLLKLRDVKNKDSDMNLLQYIVKQYLKKNERSTEKGKGETKLPSSVCLCNAAQVSFHKLKEELLKVSSLLRETEVQVTKILDECSPSERNPFKEKMRQFQEMAKQNICEKNLKMEITIKTYQETVTFFQWQPNGQKETPQQFFALWAKFIEDIKNCVKLEKHQQHQAKKNFGKVEHLNQIREAATKFKKRRESVDLL